MSTNNTSGARYTWNFCGSSANRNQINDLKKKIAELNRRLMELEIENLNRMRHGGGSSEYLLNEMLSLQKQILEVDQKILELNVTEENSTGR